MTEAKRVPTEAEARLLLLEVARRKEDEAAIEEAAKGRAPWSTGVAKGAVLILVLVVAGALWLARDEVPYPVAAILIMLAYMTGAQAAEVASLRRATCALARAAERARRAEPIPHAPSPRTL